MRTILIAIQDYQDFLGHVCLTKDAPLAEFDGFRNRHHPWGNGDNVRVATPAGLAWLEANKIRYATYTEAT